MSQRWAVALGIQTFLLAVTVRQGVSRAAEGDAQALTQALELLAGASLLSAHFVPASVLSDSLSEGVHPVLWRTSRYRLPNILTTMVVRASEGPTEIRPRVGSSPTRGAHRKAFAFEDRLSSVFWSTSFLARSRGNKPTIASAYLPT